VNQAIWTPLNIPFPITKMVAWLCKMAGSYVSICHRKKVDVPPQTHVWKYRAVGTLGGTEAMKAYPPMNGSNFPQTRAQ